MGNANTQRKEARNGQSTLEILRLTRFTLLLLVVRHHVVEVLPDYALWACDAMRRHTSHLHQYCTICSRRNYLVDFFVLLMDNEK